MKPSLLEKLKLDLRALRLKDMADILEIALEDAHQEKQGHIQFLDRLVQQQRRAMAERSLDRRVKQAKFPRKMTFEYFDWGFQPGLNVEYVKDLIQLDFVQNRQTVLILGKTGTGKTHIASALGIKACEAGYRVLFFRLQNLLSLLYATLADDTTDEVIAGIARAHLLIIDHVDFIRTKHDYPSLLLDLISVCNQRVAMIFTTKISLEQWGEALGNPSVTHAIVDRILHHAKVINIRPGGRSYRTEGPHAPKMEETQELKS
ncbi:MAG: ATP-binding protein [Deltaproteobacteria bacterium]|nr:ATP-binding protein [Deltaproteobacteria bacterium]